jgi:hypothetical protein
MVGVFKFSSINNFNKTVFFGKRSRFFSTQMDGKKPKLENLENFENFTSYSQYSNDKSNLLKRDYPKQEFFRLKKEEWGYLETTVKYWVPILLLPMAFHGCISVFDVLVNGKLVYYTPQIFLKHSLIVNSILSGIVLGYRFADENNQTKINSLIAYKVVGSCIANFLGIYFLTNIPMGYFLFNSVYLLVISSQVYILQNFNIVTHNNSKYFFTAYCTLMAIMLILVNLYLKDYRKQIETKEKFEDTFTIFQLSNDNEFKKVMHSLEVNLNPIDIKIEKISDE